MQQIAIIVSISLYPPTLTIKHKNNNFILSVTVVCPCLADEFTALSNFRFN